MRRCFNVKEDGTYFLNGIAPKKRIIKYIPSVVVDDSIMNKLRTGDYVGMYSEKSGLDVSHMGIIIKNEDSLLITHHSSVFLRHASSVKGKVFDEDFRKYITNKAGIVILRPK